MSHVTDLIFIAECFYDPDDDSFLTDYNFTRVDDYVTGCRKAMQCDMYIATMNYGDIEMLVEEFMALEFDIPECAQLLVKDEHDFKFKVYDRKVEEQS